MAIKYKLLIAAIAALAFNAKAQNLTVDIPRTKGQEVINTAQVDKQGNTKTESPPGLVPSMIIILNYDRVIKPHEYAAIKKDDIIKQYSIENRMGPGSVESVLIVETKNKEKYKKE